MKLTTSYKIYIALILLLAASAGMGIFLPQGAMAEQFELPASKTVIALVSFFIMAIVYGGLGLAGMVLSGKLGFAQLWDKKITNNQRLIRPALIGFIIGAFFIIVDLVVNSTTELGLLPHPPFPTSIVATITASIGEETVFRLFFISFWMWLLSSVILRNRWKDQIFWLVTAMSAIAFAMGHLPSFMFLYGYESFGDIPAVLIVEIILLNGVLSLFAAYYFRKYGILAAVGIHFWTDIVWHVIYGFTYA